LYDYLTALYNLYPEPSPIYNLNKALTNAARQVVNNEGPCRTKGDSNAQYVQEVLHQYAYSWANLKVYRYLSTEIVDEENYS